MPAEPSTPPWQRLFHIKPGELVPVLLSCGYFFCVLTANYVLRPVRDEMGIQRGAEGLTWLMTGTLVVTLCMNPVFSLMVGRFSRRWFIPVTYQFFAANLALFYVAMWAFPSRTEWLQNAFFIWMSVFNLFAVSVFWALMSDLFTNEQGKRLYALIGVGGTLGAIFGSQLTSAFVELVGPAAMLLVAAGFLELAIVFVLALSGQARRGTLKAETVEKSNAWEGLVQIAKRPYLQLVVAYMLLQTSLNTLLYFQQAGILADFSGDPRERTKFLADINIWVNVVTLCLQLFVSSRLIATIGITRTLLVAPAVLALGFSGLSISSAVMLLAVVQVAVRASEYAAARPARETLYTVVSRTERYQSKSFIDTFVYRGGDALAAWGNQGLVVLGLTLPVMALVSIPLATFWIATAYVLGRRQEALAAVPAADRVLSLRTGDGPG
jgi:ATP:ADP antiporter, AAA family